MNILGIDPGYGITGWAVIEYDGQKAKFLACDCIKTPASLEYSQRLELIFDKITILIKKYKPSSLGVESLFFNSNPKTVIKVSEARGVVLLAAIKNKIPVFDYTPLQVKQALIGYGRAEKKQIQQILKFHLQLMEIPKQDDAVDALAVALTHAYTNQKLK